ncbi:MAG: sugar transferase [Chloroflexi bacterium]|nr:sugar transferase [Chloroflexota bacterium]
MSSFALEAKDLGGDALAARAGRLLVRVAKPFVIATDLVLVNLAFVVAYWMRYRLDLGPEVLEANAVPLSAYVPVQVAFAGILLVTYAIGGLYRHLWAVSLADELLTIVGGTSIGVMLTLAFVFGYQAAAYSRLMFVFAWAGAIALLLSARLAKAVARTYLRSRGIGVQPVIVVGQGPLARMVMHILATEPGLGYRLVGFVDEEGRENAGRFVCLGRLDDLAAIAGRHGVDEVIIALPAAHHQLVLSLMQDLQRSSVRFKMVPDLYEISLTRVDINDLRGVPLIGLKETSIRGANLVVKRLLDVVIAGTVLAVFAPLWLLIALLIKLDSPGPVLFKQVRAGRDGRPFVMLKFRSMQQDAEREQKELLGQNEAAGPLFKIRQDPRRTRVGRLLRRASLDEVPQLWNILRGEMSLVGPRPPLPREVERYEPWHRRRLSTAPGLTGLWQVSGRSELPFDEMVLLDIYYVENWSLTLDLKTLLRTLPAVLTARGAY